MSHKVHPEDTNCAVFAENSKKYERYLSCANLSLIFLNMIFLIALICIIPYSNASEPVHLREMIGVTAVSLIGIPAIVFAWTGFLLLRRLKTYFGTFYKIFKY